MLEELRDQSLPGEVTLIVEGNSGNLVDEEHLLSRVRFLKDRCGLKDKDVIRVVREVRKLNWKPKMMGSDGLISTMLSQHKEEIDLVEGMLATDSFAHGMPLTPFGKQASEMYAKMYKDPATAHVALGAEAYALLLDAMNRCSDSADRDCINRQIRSTTNFLGIIGYITIGPDGKSRRPLCITSIKGGRSKFIFKVY